MPPNLLVFSAHAADFCSRAGGTIAKAASQGCRAHVVDVTFGELGESPKAWAERPAPPVDEVKERRRRESEEAAAILGCTIEFLDFGDNPLILTEERQQRLFEILVRISPDVVLTHWWNEPLNRDHATLANAVLDAAHFLRSGGRVPDHELRRYPQILFFEPTVPFTDMVGFHPSQYVDISGVWERKVRALEALSSQPELVRDYSLYSAYRAAQARGVSGRQEVSQAEAFVRFQPLVADPWDFAD